MAAHFDMRQLYIKQGFIDQLELHVRPVHEPYKNKALLEEIQKQQGAVSFYVTLQNSAEEVARFLQQQGFAAKPHAGLDSDVRTRYSARFYAQ